VLETIYSLAGVAPAGESGDVFRGHPLMARPAKAATTCTIAASGSPTTMSTASNSGRTIRHIRKGASAAS